MLKNSLYHYVFVPLRIIIELYYHGKDQNHIIDRRITSAIRGGLSERRKPLFPHALPCHLVEVPRIDLQTGFLPVLGGTHSLCWTTPKYTRAGR